MASKLFRAIIGVGIALGAAGGACSVVSGDRTSTQGTDASPTTPPSPPASPDTGADVTADASVIDAPDDALHDALVDAFCDDAWPTTKGNPCFDPDAAIPEAGGD